MLFFIFYYTEPFFPREIALSEDGTPAASKYRHWNMPFTRVLISRLNRVVGSSFAFVFIVSYFIFDLVISIYTNNS